MVLTYTKVYCKIKHKSLKGNDLFELEVFLDDTHTSISELVKCIALDQIALESLMGISENCMKERLFQKTRQDWAVTQSLRHN